MTVPEPPHEAQVGAPVRDVVTTREGEVVWVSPADDPAPGVLVIWPGGACDFYGADELGVRLVRLAR